MGEPGSFPTAFITKWREASSYSITLDAVKCGQENIIAMQVFSNAGGAGMYQGPYYLSPIQRSNFITVTNAYIETENKGFTRKLILI